MQKSPLEYIESCITRHNTLQSNLISGSFYLCSCSDLSLSCSDQSIWRESPLNALRLRQLKVVFGISASSSPCVLQCISVICSVRCSMVEPLNALWLRRPKVVCSILASLSLSVCVAVCFSETKRVLQCVGAFQCAAAASQDCLALSAVFRPLPLPCAAVCCSVLQCVAVCCSVLQSVLQCVLQCVAVCVAVCWRL